MALTYSSRLISALDFLRRSRRSFVLAICEACELLVGVALALVDLPVGHVTDEPPRDAGDTGFPSVTRRPQR